ncbi:hypothetical protein GDO81_011314 [Engystomops pustulosus]|uniref:Uncharacterized protein n=1 Tax=Engystomops pustulosus TaxID=76066 RepID=A0AAV7BDW5_ENGPU|nr:hypothetical protein GDO81_011314 [Engystomops pustulosus]
MVFCTTTTPFPFTIRPQISMSACMTPRVWIGRLLAAFKFTHDALSLYIFVEKCLSNAARARVVTWEPVSTKHGNSTPFNLALTTGLSPTKSWTSNRGHNFMLPPAVCPTTAGGSSLNPRSWQQHPVVDSSWPYGLLHHTPNTSVCFRSCLQYLVLL